MGEPFSGLEELRKEHLRRLRAWRIKDEDAKQQSLDDLREYLQRIAATGRVLESEYDRDNAQDILDHWEAQFAILASGVNEGSFALASHTPGGLASEDAVAASKKSARQAREQIRLAALARQWVESKRAPGYLLNGNAARSARKLQGDDPVLQEFVEASNRHEFWRSAGLIAAGALAVVSIAVPVGLWLVAEAENASAMHSARLAAILARSCSAERLELLANTQALTETVAASRCDRDPNVMTATKLSVELTNLLATTTPDASVQGTKVKGTIWLGSRSAFKVWREDKSELQLADIDNDNYVRRVMARSTLALRKQLPDPDGKLAESIGVVPRGTVVTLASRPQLIDGQYFAEIEYEATQGPTVFFQFIGTSRGKAGAFRRALSDQGYVVPGAEFMEAKPIESSVKYDADCTTTNPNIAGQAQKLADEAAAALVKLRFAPQTLALKQLSNRCRLSNSLELWIDFQEAPAEPSPPE